MTVANPWKIFPKYREKEKEEKELKTLPVQKFGQLKYASTGQIGNHVPSLKWKMWIPLVEYPKFQVHHAPTIHGLYKAYGKLLGYCPRRVVNDGGK